MVEDVYVTSVNRDITQGTPAGTDGWYRHDAYRWRCNRANRNDTAACAPPALGTPITVPYFLYLDTKESWSRDAGMSKTAPTSTPTPLAHSLSINADDASCGGSTTTTSGYDAFGNLTAEVSYTEDQGTVTLARQCARTTRSFVAPITTSGNWWVDQPDTETTTTSVSYGVSLPSGATAPSHTLVKKVVFNADRTLQSMTVQPNVANQQIVTSYGYPTPSYGLPNSMAVTASGDPNGTRTTQTTYSTDGYFPASVTNPLLQVSSTVIRSRDGQPSSATDANGLNTAMYYDPFGRMIKTSFLAADNATRRMPDVQTAVSLCASNCTTRYGLPMDAYVVTTVADGAPTTATHYDTLGRVIRTETTLIDGSRSLVDTDYNWRGLVQFQSDPYRAGETRYGTSFGIYDLIGRPDSKWVNKGNGELLTTYYGYVGRTTNIVLMSSNSQWPWRSMSRTVDALGRYVSTTDAMSGVTRYWYDANGGVVALQDAKGVNTLASYNDIGQRTSSVDPNQGTWNFTYDALGELLTQTDARTKVQNFSYDKLGRRVTRSTNASTDVVVAGALLQNAVVSDSWTWDAPNAKGQLLSVARAVNGAPQKTDTYSYDSYARRVQALTTLSANATGTGAAENYTHSWRYDTVYGRVKQHTYPSNDALWLRYARYGQLSQESDLSGAVSYRTLGTTSADVNGRGEVLRETLGSFITASYAYVAQTGQMSQAKHMINGATYPLRQLDYTYDTFGDVLTQSVTQGSVLLNSETFTYDPLFRLTQASRSANGNTNYAYDAVGNFKYKSDYSASVDTAYAYQPNSNRIASVLTKNNVSVNFNYDLNGNLISNSAGFSAIYDQDNRPVSITRSGNTTIAYGADGERYRETGSDGTRVIIGDYEKWVSTGEQKAYLGDYAVITTGSAGKKVNYLLKDRLGSVDAVANSDGSLAESRGYDAFGAPRQGTWADSPTGINLATTEKGFTQHEHLNAVGLIHMNGRAYDYALGRFLSVDPIIQFPTNSQSLNPYSYILNNPLSGKDPTGFEGVTVGGGSCSPMAGSHVCGADSGAENGASSKTFTIKDGGGNFARITESRFGDGSSQLSGVVGTSSGSLGQTAVSNQGSALKASLGVTGASGPNGAGAALSAGAVGTSGTATAGAVAMGGAATSGEAVATGAKVLEKLTVYGSRVLRAVATVEVAELAGPIGVALFLTPTNVTYTDACYDTCTCPGSSGNRCATSSGQTGQADSIRRPVQTGTNADAPARRRR